MRRRRGRNVVSGGSLIRGGSLIAGCVGVWYRRGGAGRELSTTCTHQLWYPCTSKHEGMNLKLARVLPHRMNQDNANLKAAFLAYSPGTCVPGVRVCPG